MLPPIYLLLLLSNLYSLVASNPLIVSPDTNPNDVPLSSQLLSSGITQWEGRIVSTNQKFDIQFSCRSSASFCDSARTVFQKAADRISNVLVLKHTVTMQLAMFLPCNSPNPGPSCSELRVLGFAAPSNFLRIQNSDTGETLSYPQALARELADTGGARLQDHDIVARFNALSSWWMNNGTAITSNQFDLEYVATHEFLHGFGFGVTFWIGDNSDSTVVPIPDVDDKTKTFFGWKTPSIWDKYVYDVNGNAQWLYYSNSFKEITEAFTGGKPKDLNSVGTFLEGSTAALNLAKQMYSRSTTNQSVVFRTRNENNYVIETGIKNFTQGSSLGHIDFTYYYTPNFLMVYATKANPSDIVTLGTKINTTSAPQNGIGQGIVEVLETLGYASVNYTPPTQKLKVVGSDLDNDKRPSSAASALFRGKGIVYLKGATCSQLITILNGFGLPLSIVMAGLIGLIGV